MADGGKNDVPLVKSLCFQLSHTSATSLSYFPSVCGKLCDELPTLTPQEQSAVCSYQGWKDSARCIRVSVTQHPPNIAQGPPQTCFLVCGYEYAGRSNRNDSSNKLMPAGAVLLVILLLLPHPGMNYWQSEVPTSRISQKKLKWEAKSPTCRSPQQNFHEKRTAPLCAFCFLHSHWEYFPSFSH